MSGSTRSRRSRHWWNPLLTAVADLRGFVSGDPADAAAFDSMKRFDKAAKDLAPLLDEQKDAALLQKTLTATAEWRRSVADPLLSRVSKIADRRESTTSRGAAAPHALSMT